MFESSFADKAKGHAVKIAAVAQLYAAKVEAQKHRIASGNVLYIGALKGVVLPVFNLPAVAVNDVVLMAIGNFTIGHKAVQAAKKLLPGRFHSLGSRSASRKYHSHYECAEFHCLVGWCVIVNGLEGIAFVGVSETLLDFFYDLGTAGSIKIRAVTMVDYTVNLVSIA